MLQILYWWFINLETMEKKQYSGTSLNSRISSATFLNNDTLLINRSCDRAGSSGTVDCYTLYGLNVITGKRDFDSIKQTKSGQGVRYPSLFDSMPQYPNKIIITMNRMPQFPWRFRDLYYWLDLETKQTTKIAEVPSIQNEWHSQWLIDQAVMLEDLLLLMMMEKTDKGIAKKDLYLCIFDGSKIR